MLIGVDFDNTIVCYDAIFQKVAVERGLVPPATPAAKGAVRDYLRQVGKENLWTELQGHVYGSRMLEASPFPGVLEFFARCRQREIPVRIISHRSRFPYGGEQHDLHQAAKEWLEFNGFHDPKRIGMPVSDVYFEFTKSDKVARIAKTCCTHFIDDLPELLAEPGIPAAVKKILFDPNDMHVNYVGHRAATWGAVEAMVR